MEALYVTGHSLRCAMAAMMTVMLRAKRIYAPLASKLKATYTYGQPMIGTEAFAKACDEATFGGTSRPLQSALFRYVYADDLAAGLPPRESGSFNIAFGTFALLTREYRRLRRLPLHRSIVDHGPNNYIAALAPPGVRSEFGD